MSSKTRGKRSTAREEATAVAPPTRPPQPPQNLADAGDPRRDRALEMIGGMLDEAEASLAGRFEQKRETLSATVETVGSTRLAESIRGNTKLIARVDAVRQQLVQQARDLEAEEKAIRDVIAEARKAMGGKPVRRTVSRGAG
jgi:hypothetical protein